MVENTLNSAQISLIRTLWELAQARIDDKYILPASAEEEKQAVEVWFTKVFPNECDEFIRSESVRYKRAEEIY